MAACGAGSVLTWDLSAICSRTGSTSARSSITASERDLFEAVQAKLRANAVERQVRLKGSPAILAGRIFDDRGNRMSPTRSNKGGVRYRYYVSQTPKSAKTRLVRAHARRRVRHPTDRNQMANTVRPCYARDSRIGR
jgi:hypothetical protein